MDAAGFPKKEDTPSETPKEETPNEEVIKRTKETAEAKDEVDPTTVETEQRFSDNTRKKDAHGNVVYDMSISHDAAALRGLVSDSLDGFIDKSTGAYHDATFGQQVSDFNHAVSLGISFRFRPDVKDKLEKALKINIKQK